jgi:hypothetical protein
MIFFVLFFLNFTAQAMENLPGDVFYNGIVLRLSPSTILDAKPLARWSEVYEQKKNQYTKNQWVSAEVQKELQELHQSYLEAYIKKIDDLASNSWFANVSLAGDLISLALVNKRYYHIILSTEEMQKYSKAGIEKFQKNQLCLSLDELGLPPFINGRVQAGFSSTLQCEADKDLCKKYCRVKKDSIMLEYCFQLDSKQKNIQILIAVTFGHGSCLGKNEGLFIEQGKEGYDFNCQQFAYFLFGIGNRLLERDYIQKIVKLVAFYIKQQPSLPVKLVTYVSPGNNEHKHRRTKSNLYFSAMNRMDQGKAIVGRNDTHTGIRFIMLPFSVSSKTNSVLKLIQILPMYYKRDAENKEAHRILDFYNKNFPNVEEESNNNCVIC